MLPRTLWLGSRLLPPRLQARALHAQGSMGVARLPGVLDPPADANAVELLDGGAEAFPRMLAAIQTARQSVHLESYIFRRDGVGRQFMKSLAGAARRGVRVTVVLDGWGSRLQARPIAAALRLAGVEVQIHNPLAALLFGRVLRNHRKLLLVDEEVAFLGGLNIGDEYAATRAASGWLDLAVEIRGPACAALGRALRSERGPWTGGGVRVLLSGPRGGRRLRRRYLKALGKARRSIALAQAYFLPDRHLMRSLTAAARRGVEVRLLLSGHSDVPLIRAATIRLYRKLLRAGVRIHEWTQTVFHAKAAAIDGERLLVGSFNLDPMSLVNLETLVEVNDSSVARKGEDWIAAHVAQAREVWLEELGVRGLRAWLLEMMGLLLTRAAFWLLRLLAPGRATRTALPSRRS